MLFNPNRILVLAPHTDDGELGCGGTIAKLIEKGAEVYYAAFSTANESLAPQFPKNQLEIEVREATKCLGIPSRNLIIFKNEVRKLNYVRQEILEELVRLREGIKPDLVFLPSSIDVHQDHKTVYEEGLRAFKFCSILGYELIWNNMTFLGSTFVSIKEHQLNLKIEALSCYKTQIGKPYMLPTFIKSLATIRGVQINKPFAEAFENIRICF